MSIVVERAGLIEVGMSEQMLEALVCTMLPMRLIGVGLCMSELLDLEGLVSTILPLRLRGVGEEMLDVLEDLVCTM